ncbi:MAG: HD domain-containing protein [Sphingobacteriales bacterium]|nr:HD domain-containing protein [Sphingobacteriales bacterium]
MNKHKIINDPVYGFITLNYEILYDLIEHPYFQRLRHIQQLGLSCYVYPGALHTRFHHALGATHLMHQAIDVLRSKGIAISPNEAEAVTIAILLHDIGHGPFSHALEHSLAPQVSHEALSLLFMKKLNQQFSGRLDLAIRIFKGEYHKSFLHQLVSSQLDIDRMDYLNRDSFFTGVQEGVIGSERLIKMLTIHNNNIVVEEKGILSVENFLVSRRIMYWQVYLHKTVLSAETMLVKVLKRAKQLTKQGENLFATPNFKLFLENNFTITDFEENDDLLTHFSALDDTDVWASLKVWQQHPDIVLSTLATGIVQRKLLQIEIAYTPFPKKIAALETACLKKYPNLTPQNLPYFIYTDTTSNSAYSYKASRIQILRKDGNVSDITQASDYQHLAQLATPVVKYFICYPKNLQL